jgi:SAM-dependent methyltransferase
MQAREQRTVFGEAADEYDRIRPGYPAAMVDEIISLARTGPALEVGAGTGKATALFSRPGLDLTCIEPDARMAQVLRRNVPGVNVVVSTFEDWRPDRGYSLLYSGQAWHWVDPARRAELAWAALAPGGLFAPFWNVFLVADPLLHAALAQVDDRHGLLAHTAHRYSATAWPSMGDFQDEWSQLDLSADRFTDLASRRYESALSYSSSRYRQYLLSTSLYRLLDPAAAEAALVETAAVIDDHGGTIEFVVSTDLALARRIAN